MRPRRTGVREAKAHLSRLLRQVQRGQEWVITDRGKPVARLAPVATGALTLEERVRRLEEAGLLEPPGRPVRDLPPPMPLPEGLAQRWLQEDRGA